MTKALKKVGDVDALADEIKATFTERVFNAREEIIMAHHETGKAMVEYTKAYGGSVSLLVKSLVERNAGTETSLFMCHKFYEVYPNINDLDRLGLGKNLSWNKIRLSLAEPKEIEVCKHPDQCRTCAYCHDCKKIIS